VAREGEVVNTSGNPGLVAMWQIDRTRAINHIIGVLKQTKGDIQLAAKALKVNRRSLHRWIREERPLANHLKSIRKSHT
jgi:ActR/RegA family two-component response regulator